MARSKPHRGVYGQQTFRGGGIARGNVMRPSTQRAIVMYGTGTTAETRICPTCREPVPVNTKGKLRGHRVGTSQKKSWPCPGDPAEAEVIE